MRRFPRLTSAFREKFENPHHALALYFTFYDFVRIHRTLKVTPAMATGISDRLWRMDDIAGSVDAADLKPGKRGPYKTRVPAGSGEVKWSKHHDRSSQ